MSYPRPTTFNEVKLIMQCKSLEHLLPDADEVLMERIYTHLKRYSNRVVVSEDVLMFYEGDSVVDTLVLATAISEAVSYISLSLTDGLQITRPYTASSDGDSGGSSGNNNNNNNNNNNA